jgi:cytochrome c-type biogenesis protein CcmH
MRLFLAALIVAPALAAAQDAPPAPEAGDTVKAGGLDAAFVAGLVGAPRGPKLTGAALDRRTDEVGAKVRCPVCQGSTVADSPSQSARNMKEEIRQLLSQGFDEEQIIAYFEKSYGEFIRLEPRAEGITWLVWLLPVLALLAGAFFVRAALARRPAPAAASAALEEDAPARDALPDDPELAGAVKRVRELAYGWPGGVPPEGAR